LRSSWVLAGVVWLVVSAVGPAEADDVYIVGEDVDTGPDLGPQHTTVTKLRDHRYSERFAVERVTLAPDGSEVVALTRASREGAKSWDLGTGRSRKLPPMSRDAATIAWSPAKDAIAVTVMADVLSGQQAGIELLSMADGRSLGFLIGGETAKSLAFSPDGTQLAAATGDGVLLFELPGGRSRLAVELGSGADAVSWVSPSQLMVATEGGSRVMRTDLDGNVQESWSGARSDGGVCFSPTGQYLVVGAEGELNIVELWGGGGTQRVLLEGAVTSLAWSMNGRTLAAGTDIGLVHVFIVEGAAGIEYAREPAAPRGRGSARAERDDQERDERAGRTERGRNDRDDRGRDDRGRDGRDDRGRDGRDDRGARDDRDDRRDDGLITLRGDERSRDTSGGGGGGVGGDGGAPDLEATLSVLVLESMSSDPRDGASMEASLNKSIKRLEPCWKRQIRAGKLGAGKLILELGVNANGEGVAVQTPVEDTFENEKLLSCLGERLRESLFGSGLGSMDVELTIELQ